MRRMRQDPLHGQRYETIVAPSSTVLLLRKALDETVRRAADGTSSSTTEHEREIAEVRAELAVQEARAAKWERAYSDLMARQAVLAASEARYRLAVESATDYSMFTTDLAGRITVWNTGAQNLRGWGGDEIGGLPANVIFTPEDNREAVPEDEMRTAVKEDMADDNR